MLIPEKMSSVIRILLTAPLGLRVAELAKMAGLTHAMASRHIQRLAKSGYVSFRGGKIKLLNRDKLIRAWGYFYSMNELEKQEFMAAEGPQHVMTRIANAARTGLLPVARPDAGQLHGLKYAFTLFSATEVIRPYVAPSETHVYARKDDAGRWREILKNENMLPTDKGGNVVLYLVDEDYFEGVWDARGVNVVSLPQLYADLFSVGGRGEEAAEQILGIIRDQQSNRQSGRTVGGPLRPTAQARPAKEQK